MEIMINIAVFLFVPVCVILTLIILLQDSKGEGLSSSAFGGSGMESVLGGRGAATLLGKLTTWFAVGFMVISLFLMRFYGEDSGDVYTTLEQEQQQQGDVPEPVDTTTIETDESATEAGEDADGQTSKTQIEDGTADDTE